MLEVEVGPGVVLELLERMKEECCFGVGSYQKGEMIERVGIRGRN